MKGPEPSPSGGEDALEKAVAAIPEALRQLMEERLRAEFRELVRWPEKTGHSGEQ